MARKTNPIVDKDSIEDAINEGLEGYKKGRVTQSFGSVKEFKATLKKRKNKGYSPVIG
ncbi:MAG: hypothetical protein GY941_30630 [Planctomycetes bacterium]|nr:hypothetical protein [Planctomycetota bacterium]